MAHGLEHTVRADHVLLEIAVRVLQAVPHVRIGREVNHGVRAGEQVGEVTGLGDDVADHERCTLIVEDVLDELTAAGGEVVDRDDLVPSIDEGPHEVRSDEPRTTRDDDSHRLRAEAVIVATHSTRLVPTASAR